MSFEGTLFFVGVGDDEMPRSNAVAAERLSEPVGVAAGVGGKIAFVLDCAGLLGVKCSFRVDFPLDGGV